jgi:hypothetical protein
MSRLKTTLAMRQGFQPLTDYRNDEQWNCRTIEDLLSGVRILIMNSNSCILNPEVCFNLQIPPSFQ